ANFVTPTELADGVYFGFSDLSNYRHHPSIIFIGIPTTMGNTQRRIETYLLDIPDKDYYQLPVTIVLEYFHRTNQTFDSVNALMAAMKTDEATMRKWLSTL
ncbi:MAG TPA: riboflavin kinase, partial [Candidatus Saccharimonadia bacterium]